MRRLRSLVVLVSLCLLLGAPVMAAAEAPSPPAKREADGLAGILGQLEALFTAVWENESTDEGCIIDPLGGVSTNCRGTATANRDEGCEIDPLGRCGR